MCLFGNCSKPTDDRSYADRKYSDDFNGFGTAFWHCLILVVYLSNDSDYETIKSHFITPLVCPFQNGHGTQLSLLRRSYSRNIVSL